MNDDCLACALSSGRKPLPGGLIHRTTRWRVEHCVGPFGVGALVVKPDRHVLHLADLDAHESSELGPLLCETSKVITELVQPEQVYVSLWAHAGGQPDHVHFVLQPVTTALAERFGARGTRLQMAMLAEGELPDDADVSRFADDAKARFARP
jgi:diadenosine tetraphosphate (Ap4A) HIT family hydrolase